MSTFRGGASLVALVLLAACAAPPPPQPPTLVVTTPTPTPVALVCTSELIDQPPVDTVATGIPSTGGPEVAPHQVENNGWKQRRPLTRGDHDAATAALAKIGPPMADVCARQTYTVDAVRKVLLEQGFDPNTFGATGLRQPAGSNETPVGVVYSLQVAGACVVGDLRPSSIRTWIQGPTGEGTCLEPFTH